MSTVLGSAVGAVADDRGGQTKRTYETVGGDLGTPYAEVQSNLGRRWVVGIKAPEPWNCSSDVLWVNLLASETKPRR